VWSLGGARRRNRYKYNSVNTNLSATEFLVEEGIDVAIRMGPRADSGLVAREFADASVFVCSSKRYLKNHGVPRQPLDLVCHNCLTCAYSPQETDWPFVRTESSNRSGFRAAYA
jgi:DNA-binding transcriptional LysR family regulator